MLETVQAFAGLELTASGERDETLEGLARYCVSEAFLAGEGLGEPRVAEGRIAQTILRTTAAPSRGSSSAAVPPKRPRLREAEALWLISGMRPKAFQCMGKS
jgi:hypothetical protein